MWAHAHTPIHHTHSTLLYILHPSILTHPTHAHTHIALLHTPTHLHTTRPTPLHTYTPYTSTCTSYTFRHRAPLHTALHPSHLTHPHVHSTHSDIVHPYTHLYTGNVVGSGGVPLSAHGNVVLQHDVSCDAHATCDTVAHKSHS